MSIIYGFPIMQPGKNKSPHYQTNFNTEQQHHYQHEHQHDNLNLSIINHSNHNSHHQNGDMNLASMYSAAPATTIIGNATANMIEDTHQIQNDSQAYHSSNNTQSQLPLQPLSHPSQQSEQQQPQQNSYPFYFDLSTHPSLPPVSSTLTNGTNEHQQHIVQHSSAAPTLPTTQSLYHQHQTSQQLPLSLPLPHQQQHHHHLPSEPVPNHSHAFDSAAATYEERKVAPHTTTPYTFSEYFQMSPQVPSSQPASTYEQRTTSVLRTTDFNPTTPDTNSNAIPQTSTSSHSASSSADKPQASKSSLMCKTCGKVYSRRDNLAAHQRVHTGEKPYACTKCGKHFRWQSALRNHEGAHLRRGSQPVKRGRLEKKVKNQMQNIQNRKDKQEAQVQVSIEQKQKRTVSSSSSCPGTIMQNGTATNSPSSLMTSLPNSLKEYQAQSHALRPQHGAHFVQHQEPYHEQSHNQPQQQLSTSGNTNANNASDNKLFHNVLANDNTNANITNPSNTEDSNNNFREWSNLIDPADIPRRRDSV